MIYKQDVCSLDSGCMEPNRPLFFDAVIGFRLFTQPMEVKNQDYDQPMHRDSVNGLTTILMLCG